METLVLFGQLAWTFFVIGAFTIGGGYAMLSLIQNQVVVEHPWISESTFTDIVAVSQMTPGPIGINSATYVGYDVLLNATGSQLLGVCGSLTATLSLMLPSFIIVLLIVRFYERFRTSKLYAGLLFLSSKPPGRAVCLRSKWFRKTFRTGKAGAFWSALLWPVIGER